MKRFIDRAELHEHFAGRRVALVGSGPGVLDNVPGYVDAHDVVVRVNNYKLGPAAGTRTDVHYSFHGSSIHKDAAELRADGVRLVLCKCPDAKFMESEWHRRMGKPHGVDFRYIYRQRAAWWWCDTYIPSVPEFVASFELLQRHIPSTGFSALLLIKSLRPASLYLTGFDFFASRVHNVNEPWRPGNPDDPIGHAPELERQWLREHLDGVALDQRLTTIMKDEQRAVLVSGD
jgi:hypothetical protein